MQEYPHKRETNRVPLEIPIQIGGEQAISRDISLSGIYFKTSKEFQPGENLQFEFRLGFAAPGQSLLLDCQGAVVRVEKLDNEYGIAATIDEITYLH